MKSKVTLVFLAAIFLCTTPARPANDIISLVEKHKGDVVLVDFWASWCAPCLKSFPWMNALTRDLGTSGLTVIAINVDSDTDAARQFLEDHPALFSVVFDSTGEFAKQLMVETMPSSFLFSRTGELVHKQPGFQTKHSRLYRSLIEIELKR